MHNYNSNSNNLQTPYWREIRNEEVEEWATGSYYGSWIPDLVGTQAWYSAQVMRIDRYSQIVIQYNSLMGYWISQWGYTTSELTDFIFRYKYRSAREISTFDNRNAVQKSVGMVKSHSTNKFQLFGGGNVGMPRQNMEYFF